MIAEPAWRQENLAAFLRFKGRVAAVAARFGKVAKRYKKINFLGSFVEQSHENSCKVVHVVLVFSSTMKYI